MARSSFLFSLFGCSNARDLAISGVCFSAAQPVFRRLSSDEGNFAALDDAKVAGLDQVVNLALPDAKDVCELADAVCDFFHAFPPLTEEAYCRAPK